VKQAFQLTAQDMAIILKMDYQLSAQATAQALRGAGYAADQVAGAMKTAFNLTAEQAQAVLNAVGYAANEVADAMKSVFNWIKKNPFAPLDPRHW
jgi:hypothetical protein